MADYAEDCTGQVIELRERMAKCISDAKHFMGVLAWRQALDELRQAEALSNEILHLKLTWLDATRSKR